MQAPCGKFEGRTLAMQTAGTARLFVSNMQPGDIIALFRQIFSLSSPICSKPSPFCFPVPVIEIQNLKTVP